MAQRLSHHVNHNPRGRSRRAHKKSRSGCANCRLRRVKCDERRPECQKCIDYMVPCSYTTNLDITDPHVIPSFTAIRLDSSTGLQILENSPAGCIEIPRPIKISVEQQTLVRFKNRTVLTLGTHYAINRYAEILPQLALEHEHLFHAIIAITIVHDRALTKVTRPSKVESYHLGQAAALFNRKLSGRITENDCDAVWATAIYLCATACFAINTADPEEVFPLKFSTSLDLEWLRMQAGLKVVWHAIDLHRSNSPLCQMTRKNTDNCVFPLNVPSGIFGLPQNLVNLCELMPASTSINNPYHTAVHHLSWMLKLDCKPANMLKFMIFAGGMTQEFNMLLRRRDPRALLLLALWYSKLVMSSWWMVSRATVELESICRYLDRFYPNEHRIHQVLQPVRQPYSAMNWAYHQGFAWD